MIRRSDKAFLGLLAALLLVCVGVPQALLWADPTGDTISRWYHGVFGGSIMNADMEEARLWRAADDAPLPADGRGWIPQELKRLPEPVARRPLDPAEIAAGAWVRDYDHPDKKTYHLLAYESDPDLPRDRWGNRWVLVLPVMERTDGSFWWEWSGRVISPGPGGQVDWGQGDDLFAWGSGSYAIPNRHWMPLFWLIGGVATVCYLAWRARSLELRGGVTRVAVVSALQALPVALVVGLLCLGLDDEIDRSLVAIPFRGLLVFEPHTALALTMSGGVWAILMWWNLNLERKRRASEAADALPEETP